MNPLIPFSNGTLPLSSRSSHQGGVLRLPEVLWGKIREFLPPPDQTNLLFVLESLQKRSVTVEGALHRILWAQEAEEGIRVLEEYFKGSSDQIGDLFIEFLFKKQAVLPKCLIASERFYAVMEGALTKREHREKIEEKVYQLVLGLTQGGSEEKGDGLFIASMIRRFCTTPNKKASAIAIFLSWYRELVDRHCGKERYYWMPLPLLSLAGEIEDPRARVDLVTSLDTEDVIASLLHRCVSFEEMIEFIEREEDLKEKEKYLYAVGVGGAFFHIKYTSFLNQFLSQYIKVYAPYLRERILSRLGIVNDLLIREGLLSIQEAFTFARGIHYRPFKEMALKRILLYLEGLLKREMRHELEGVVLEEEDRAFVEGPLYEMVLRAVETEIEKVHFWEVARCLMKMALTGQTKSTLVGQLLVKVREHTNIKWGREREFPSIPLALVEEIEEGEERRKLARTLHASHPEDLASLIQLGYISLEEGALLLKEERERLYAVVLGGVLFLLRKGMPIKDFWDRHISREEAGVGERILLRLGEYYKELIEQGVITARQAIDLADQSHDEKRKERACRSIQGALKKGIEEGALSVGKVVYFLSWVCGESLRGKALEEVVWQYRGVEVFQFLPLVLRLEDVDCKKRVVDLMTKKALHLLKEDEQKIETLVPLFSTYFFPFSDLFIDGLRAVYFLQKEGPYQRLPLSLRRGYLYILAYTNPAQALACIESMGSIKEKKEALLPILSHLYYFVMRSAELLPRIFALSESLPLEEKKEGVFEVLSRLKRLIESPKGESFFCALSQIDRQGALSTKLEVLQMAGLIWEMVLGEGYTNLTTAFKEARKLFHKMGLLEYKDWTFFKKCCLLWFFQGHRIEEQKALKMLDYVYKKIFQTREEKESLIEVLVEAEEGRAFLHSDRLKRKVLEWIHEFSENREGEAPSLTNTLGTGDLDGCD